MDVIREQFIKHKRNIENFHWKFWNLKTNKNFEVAFHLEAHKCLRLVCCVVPCALRIFRSFWGWGRDFSTETPWRIPHRLSLSPRNGRIYHRALEQELFTNRYCPQNCWKIYTIFIFLWLFSINYHKLKENVKKFRGFAPESQVNYTRTVEFNNIQFRFTPRVSN